MSSVAHWEASNDRPHYVDITVVSGESTIRASAITLTIKRSPDWGGAMRAGSIHPRSGYDGHGSIVMSAESAAVFLDLVALETPFDVRIEDETQHTTTLRHCFAYLTEEWNPRARRISFNFTYSGCVTVPSYLDTVTRLRFLLPDGHPLKATRPRALNRKEAVEMEAVMRDALMELGILSTPTVRGREVEHG